MVGSSAILHVSPCERILSDWYGTNSLIPEMVVFSDVQYVEWWTAIGLVTKKLSSVVFVLDLAV